MNVASPGFQSAIHELELLFIGNAIVDVFAHDENGLALRYGLCEPVQHVEIEKAKTIFSELGLTSFAGDTNKADGITVVSGGGAANAAKIAGLLGAKACFTGAIGSDHFGLIFEEDLKSAGVKTLLVQKRPPTGICLVLQTGDGTRIAASPSAAMEFSEYDLNEEEVQKAKVVVLDGFMLGRHSLVRRIMALADKYGAATAIDLGSAAIAAEEASEIAVYAASIDASSNVGECPFFLFMNEDEAASFYNALNKPAAAFTQTQEFFKSFTEGKPSLVIVVKQGKRGAEYFTGGKCFRAETEAVEPLETTGTGDAFCGAFLTAWARGKPLTECAALGNKAARVVLDGAGTRVDKNAFKDLAALLEKSAVP